MGSMTYSFFPIREQLPSGSARPGRARHRAARAPVRHTAVDSRPVDESTDHYLDQRSDHILSESSRPGDLRRYRGNHGGCGADGNAVQAVASGWRQQHLAWCLECLQPGHRAVAIGGESEFLGLPDADLSTGQWVQQQPHNWVDGLQQSQIVAQYNQLSGLLNAGAYGAVAWDQTTTPNGSLAISQNFNASSVVVNTFARDTNTLLGRHYVQALERAQSGTPRFYGFGEGSSVLEVELEM